MGVDQRCPNIQAKNVYTGEIHIDFLKSRKSNWTKNFMGVKKELSRNISY